MRMEQDQRQAGKGDGCKACQLSRDKALYGVYCFACARCCARLIRSARPLRSVQEAMFAAIGRLQGAPTKNEIIEAIRTIDSEEKCS